ncbi:serine/threonine protein kinase [Colwellia psychrerythraea]|uniref:Serine/threonine protein kinase n=1 Tax=Colwellia psychrerythraea TaxID=28229 RepID=A0A099KZA4_COLPS|nr:protein kinase [Colwellia psychrerythraea]KGJ95142.1 serine/threonine protein kinase [Colwellia psychrerythraea]
MTNKKLQHFYIAQEQSIYLLSHKDATKLKEWVDLCQQQLKQLGFEYVALLGKGAYGFVFSGIKSTDGLAVELPVVFKFSRINLPQHVQDRLAEEADIQGQLDHPQIPKVIDYQKIKRQSILQMGRAPGLDLEKLSLRVGPLPPELVVSIALQLADILLYLRQANNHRQLKPIVHGDIKPSNLVYDEDTGKVQLIDWGSSVSAQLDCNQQSTSTNVMELMSSDLQNSNARLGDVYFIGPEQLNGGLSTPRFDEQGLAATLYALASGQSCRYGVKVISPNALGLPKLLAQVLTGMLSDDAKRRGQAGDYFFNNLSYLKKVVLSDKPTKVDAIAQIPVWVKAQSEQIDTVVYGSRKSFLREQTDYDNLSGIDDAQLDKYYKNYLMGMGDNEKALIAALSRLGNFPVVGGIAIRWAKEGVYIDSNLTLFDEALKTSFTSAVNNIVYLAQGIYRVGVFKSCLFNARNTLHVERQSEDLPFIADGNQEIGFEISAVPDVDDVTRLHSYFEDGKDPDEYLYLPDELMSVLAELNLIHHTGCIIFEVLPTHLKIHSYLMLLNHEKEAEFKACLAQFLALLPTIDGIGISGFMKLPYKDTRFFEHISSMPDKFYPRNPKLMSVSHEKN